MNTEELDKFVEEQIKAKAEAEAKIERQTNNTQDDVSEEDIVEQSCQENPVVVKEAIDKYQLETQNNKLVNTIMQNDTAISIAKQKFEELKNQKQLATKMGKVVNKKADADIETADLKVEQQRVANKVEKARQKNELLKCKNERKFLKRESKHNLSMQKFEQRKEKYGDLLLRHCRKKIKNAEGKWEYQFDKNGNAIINMPNGFILFWLIVFDSIVMFLNQTADIFAGLNKVVFKTFWIILICIILLVPAFRQWLFGLIGLNIA